MRIVITFPFSLATKGGGPIHCEQLALQMRAQGCSVTVMPIAAPWGKWGTRPVTPMSSRETHLADHHVEVIRVRPHPVHYAFDSLELRKQIRMLESRERVDGVLSWWTEAAFLPGYLRRRRIPFGMIAAASYADRISTHNTTTQAVLDRFGLWRPLRLADAVYANSKFTAQEVISMSGVSRDRVHVTYCGIEPSFRNVPRLYGDVPNRFIFFGHLSAPKGLLDTLDALGRLKQAGFSEWKLKIAGWGDEERIRQSARAKGIADQIELLGPINRPQLLTELEWAQLAILPSHMDSFGLVAAEAQAAGLPVIGYDIGGISEIVDNGNTGWLVPLGRIDLVAESIVQAISNPLETFKRGISGRKRSERFSWEKVAGTILTDIDTQLSRLRAHKPSFSLR